MGNNSRERREARRRSQARPIRVDPRSDPRESSTGPLSLAEVQALIDMAARYASAAPRAAVPRIMQLNDLGAAAAGPDHDPAVMVVDQVLARIGTAWEHGWQPPDLVHVTRRRTSAQAARWMARAILLEADRSRAMERAPQEWIDQLAALASRRTGAGRQDELLATSGRADAPEWTVALVVLDFIRQLPRVELLVPPPSRWGMAQPTARPASQHSSSQHSSSQHSAQQAKTLTKVRALLAKAESTEFAAEADALTAKAQDIMTRHAIDEALLADESGGSFDVRGRRVLVHHPYAMEKAGLLDVVARANRTRAVWHSFASYMTLVGAPTDLDQVEMLFTSTLVQATKAMTHVGETSGPSGADRSSAFRKAFLNAYAIRIGERLTSTADEAVATYGTDLVPVFARQGVAITKEFERLFPHVTHRSRRAQFDARGWEAGTRAANEAVLPAGMVES